MSKPIKSAIELTQGDAVLNVVTNRYGLVNTVRTFSEGKTRVQVLYLFEGMRWSDLDELESVE